MKFGGTSVGAGSSIRKVVGIIQSAALESNIIVVVSAMSGVTNKLLEAAEQSQAGDGEAVKRIFDAVREQHEAAVHELICSPTDRERILETLNRIFQEGYRLCEGVMLLRELTPRSQDSISSLGERLCAPLLAAALVEQGVKSEPIESTDLVITDSNFGAADPLVDRTRERCIARLCPMLEQEIVPVVTGFLGATAEGLITTLGRGGSDYSATIVGAALEVDEVVIWTDVDGLMSTDPHAVPTAATITEISYREAAELAYFGAKVLHPKSLRGVSQHGIPVWIRNTFAPERPGTKITPTGSPNGAGVTVKAVAVITEVALINVAGSGVAGVPDILQRTLATIVAMRVDVLVVLQSSSQSDVCVVVPSAMAKSVVEALRFEFGGRPAYPHVAKIAVDLTTSLVTIVGQNMRGASGILRRTFRALDSESVNVIAIAQGSSECNLSFVVAQKDVKTALAAVHQEFQLGRSETPRPAASNVHEAAVPAV
jgi:bifunctional aspartokinase / homoserine dehydrogenase 1